MSTPRRKAPRPPADVARGLQSSLESAARGLERLLQSVEQSGLAEGVRSYRMLQTVLIQQRQWAGAHAQRQLLPLFRAIGEASAKLHRTFAAYAEITGSLAAIERIAPAENAPGEPAATESAATESAEDATGEPAATEPGPPGITT